MYSTAEVDALIQRVAANDSTLRDLNFFAHNIGDEKVVALAEALKTNDSLQDLSLGFNGIQARGAAAIAEALKVNKSLKVLSLDGNEIDDEGTILMAQALRVNNSLEDFNLGFNKVKDAGVNAITETLLAGNYSLKHFLTRRNEIEVTDDNEWALESLLRRNRFVKSISDKIFAGKIDALNPNQFGISEYEYEFITAPNQAEAALKILEIVCTKLSEIGESGVETGTKLVDKNIIKSVTDSSPDGAMIKVMAAKAPRLLEQTPRNLSPTNPLLGLYSVIKQTDLFDFFRRSGVIKSSFEQESAAEGKSLSLLSLTKDARSLITSFLGVNDVNFKAVKNSAEPVRGQVRARRAPVQQPTAADIPTVNPQNSAATNATNIIGHNVGDGGCCTIS